MSLIILNVDEVRRTLSASGGAFVTHDKEVDIVRFAINSGFADIVLDGQVALRVMYQRPGETEVRAKTLTYHDTDGLRNYYDWNLLSADLEHKGTITCALCILRTDSEVEEWHTTPCQVRVLDTIHTDDSDSSDETITPTVAQRVAVLETMIQRVASGAPIVVANASAMTNIDQIYVLSTDGEWYYHNGTAWVAGGEYGGVPTDKTLSLPGLAADAKVTGDKINKKITMPSSGTEGQLLQYVGDGNTRWATFGSPTDEQVENAIAEWLDDHPEATTTVEDGAISAEKLNDDLTIAKIDNYASPMDYGATGDGEHDDTAAFAAAENSSKGIIYVPKGVYKVSGITTNKSIIMDSEAWLTTDTDKADVLTITGDDGVYRLNLRLKDTYAHAGITVSGNHNHFEMVNIDGLNYDGVTLYPNNKVNIGLHILGDYNTFDFVKMNDFVQDYAGNDSAPQGIAIDKNANCNYIADFNIVNCRSGIVSAGYVGTANRIGSMSVVDCSDNGLYCVGGGHTEVGTLFYRGTNECLAVITDGATASTPENLLTNVQVGTIICKGETGFEFPVRIKNAGEIKIGSLFVNGEVNSIIFTNDNTYLSAGIDIGNLIFDGSAQFAFYLPASRGTLKYLTIGRAMIKDKHSNAALDLTANSGNYLIVDMAQKLSIDRLDLAIADKDGAYSGKILHPRMILNSALTDSFLGRISCQNLANANSLRLDIVNAIQDGITHVYGYFQYNDAENKVSIYHNNNYSDKLYSRLTPQYGTWKVGATVYTERTQNINEGVVGWVCIQAGTPGLWREIKVWPYAGAVRYEGGNLQYYNASTGSWTGVSV